MTCRDPSTFGVTVLIRRTSRAMASASSRVKLVVPWDPVRTPFGARPPASIQTKLSPRLRNSSSARRDPAWPMAITHTTAAIPIMMASAARTLRSLLRKSARNASRQKSAPAVSHRGITEIYPEALARGYAFSRARVRPPRRLAGVSREYAAGVPPRGRARGGCAGDRRPRHRRRGAGAFPRSGRGASLRRPPAHRGVYLRGGGLVGRAFARRAGEGVPRHPHQRRPQSRSGRARRLDPAAPRSRGAGHPRLLPQLDAAAGSGARISGNHQPGAERSGAALVASRPRPARPAGLSGPRRAASPVARAALDRLALPRVGPAGRLLDRERSGAGASLRRSGGRRDHDRRSRPDRSRAPVTTLARRHQRRRRDGQGGRPRAGDAKRVALAPRRERQTARVSRPALLWNRVRFRLRQRAVGRRNGKVETANKKSVPRR